MKNTLTDNPYLAALDLSFGDPRFTSIAQHMDREHRRVRALVRLSIVLGSGLTLALIAFLVALTWRVAHGFC